MSSNKRNTRLTPDLDVSAMSEELSEERSKITDFFEGKCVFITGASGFIGSVLLETLLRCCPGIKFVYVLLREKKGIDPATRKSQLINEQIFQKLKNVFPEVLDKIIVVPGDLEEENLGISEITESEMIKNVTVVFHCAADVTFNKDFGHMILQNCVGTVNVVKICRKLQNCAAFIYASSASTCLNGLRKEALELLPISSEEVLEIARNGDDKKLLEIAEKCKIPFLNTYIFSKVVCEDYLCRAASDIPILVVRPTYVVNCWKGACPGYMHRNVSTLLVPNLFNGTFQVGLGCPRTLVDIVPADIVANTLITAAWYLNSHKPEKNFVINNVRWESLKTLSDFVNDGVQFVKDSAPKDKMLKEAFFVFKGHFYTYIPLVLLRHYLPAIVIDAIRLFQGKPPQQTIMYLKLDVFFHYLKFVFFSDGELDFGNFPCENFKLLMKSQNKRDKELFLIDTKDFKYEDFYESVRKYAANYFVNIEAREKEYIRLQWLKKVRTAVKMAIVACIIWLFKVILNIIYP